MYRVIQRLCKECKRTQRALHSSSGRVDRNFFCATQIGTLRVASRFPVSPIRESEKRCLLVECGARFSRRGRKTRQRTVIPTKDKPSYLPWPMCAALYPFRDTAASAMCTSYHMHIGRYGRGLYIYTHTHCTSPRPPMCSAAHAHRRKFVKLYTWLFCELEGFPD